jgi:hypothetical protein
MADAYEAFQAFAAGMAAAVEQKQLQSPEYLAVIKGETPENNVPNIIDGREVLFTEMRRGPPPLPIAGLLHSSVKFGDG